MGRKVAASITLTERQERTLKKIGTDRRSEHRYHQRAIIILRAAAGESNRLMAKRMNVSREFVQRWRWRWGRNKEVLSKLEVEEENRAYFEGVLKILSDEPRAGHPLKFTAEQVCQIMAIACEKPQDSGHILSHWGTQQLALEVMKGGIVESISKTQVGRFLKSERY